MKHQAFRPVAMMLCVLLTTAAPAQAGTIEFADVALAVNEGRPVRPAAELRLRVMSQSGRAATETQTGQQSGNATAPTQEQTGAAGGETIQTGPSGSTQTEGTLTQSGSGQIETVDLGDVTGTVCDCGEIPPPPTKGGFPKWPFLALAGIPLAFIGGGDTPPPIVTPTPNIPQTPVPEPATLFLFGTGLLAAAGGARRRYARKLSGKQAIAAAEEV